MDTHDEICGALTKKGTRCKLKKHKCRYHKNNKINTNSQNYEINSKDMVNLSKDSAWDCEPSF